jgi:hypothetical protein
MESKVTERGFHYSEFNDANGTECNIQESSAMRDEGLIWFGSAKIGLQHFRPEHGGWKEVTEPDEVHTMTEHYVANNRMHLTQSQVKDLLPALQYFAEHGILPE